MDPGSVRTGLAIGEDGLSVAVPHATLQHRTPAEAIAQVVAVVEREAIEEIVVGLPLRLDGTEGEAARRSRHFAALLAQRSAVPVILWDERLSTAAAERVLKESGVGGKARRAVVDQAAATLLLQNYLDAQQEHSWEAPSDLMIPEPEGGGGRPRSRRGRRRGRGGGST